MSLATDIDFYKKYTSDHLNEMKKYYEEHSSLDKAISNASIGKNDSNIMDPHQWLVGKVKGEIGAKELNSRIFEIKNAQSFEDIFEITESVIKKIYGLGDLWSYDTALRIGFFLRKYPKEVYIQRGVVHGVKKIFKNKIPKGRSLDVSIFPKELQQLKPYEIENFLSIWGKEENKKSNC